ncbi:LCP family protein [Streptomyces sp. NPDC059740]|uniref:LCP family protein n=1 Tax=Streptomyces sp. NPDC059740 TaxID=3346926 RepID=UPI00365C12E3
MPRGDARHAKTTPAARRPRRSRVLIGALATVLAVTGAGGWWVYERLDGNLSTVDLAAQLGADRPPRGAAGGTNLLLLGSDSRAGANHEYGGDVSGARSDTAMVVHLPPDRRRATVVSIPRDTMVHRPQCTLPGGKRAGAARSAMFNTAYALGGSTCAVRTVEDMSGLRIDHVLDIGFTGFKRLVDALGGVKVTTDEDIHDRWSGLDLPAGTHRLDGEQALGLVRTRHGVGDGSDLGRIHLQQRFLAALATQLRSEGLLTHPTRLYRVADAATSALTTDSGLASVGSLLHLAGSLSALKPGAVDFRTLPVGPYPTDPNRVQAVQPQAGDLWTALREGGAPPAAEQ